MSKQSKQERAKRYAEGAQECVRIATVHADEAWAKIADIVGHLSGLKALVADASDRYSAAVRESEEISAVVRSVAAELSALKTQASECESVLSSAESRVEGAKGTLNETMAKLTAMASHFDVDGTTTAPESV